MINMESIEIVVQLGEVLFLLVVICFGYFFLIIGREVLVLFFGSKIIGWCFGLVFYVVQFGFYLGIGIVMVDFDWDIFFEYDFVFVGIVVGFY